MDQDTIAEIASALEVDIDVLTPELRLDSLDSWDSVNRLTIMVIVGDAVGEPVLPSEIAKLETFGDLEMLIAKKKA